MTDMSPTLPTRRWHWRASIVATLVVAILLFTPLGSYVLLSTISFWEEGFSETGRAQREIYIRSLAAYFEDLPRDEQMILHFREHRNDFEEFIDIYRSDNHGLVVQRIGDEIVWQESPELARVKQETGIQGFWPSSGLWLPDPYLVETAKKAKTLNSIKAFKFHAVMISLSLSDYERPTLRHGLVRKGFWYFPVAPRIDAAKLLGPVNTQGAHTSITRVVDTLDQHPSAWRSGECVIRPIEPQWYLSLCRS